MLNFIKKIFRPCINCVFVIVFALFANGTKSYAETTKIMHISFDDVRHILNNLIQNKDIYQSIFENPLLEKLKYYHEEYGAVFSLYCFVEFESDGWKIEPLPLPFAEEFVANADWLKLGYHTRNADTSTANYDVKYYNEFLTVIPEEVENREKCFDLIPRLHGFAGSLAFCKDLQNATPGLKGFLSADDTRNSYYLDKTQSTYINTHDVLYDQDNDLYFFSTEKRLESVGNIDTHLKLYLTSPIYADRADYMIIFTHENQVYSHSTGLNTTNGMLDKIETCLKWGKENQYQFDFPMNILDEVPLSPSGIDNHENENYVKIIERMIVSKEPGTFKIFNATGKLLLQEESVCTVDMSLFPGGFYVINFEGLNGVNVNEKIILF